MLATIADRAVQAARTAIEHRRILAATDAAWHAATPAQRHATAEYARQTMRHTAIAGVAALNLAFEARGAARAIKLARSNTPWTPPEHPNDTMAWLIANHTTNPNQPG